jgi:hypothetical protein
VFLIWLQEVGRKTRWLSWRSSTKALNVHRSTQGRILSMQQGHVILWHQLIRSASAAWTSFLRMLQLPSKLPMVAGKRLRMSPNQQPVCILFFYIFHNHVATTCKQKLQSHTQPFCKHTSHNTFFVLLQENQTVFFCKHTLICCNHM